MYERSQRLQVVHALHVWLVVKVPTTRTSSQFVMTYHTTYYRSAVCAVHSVLVLLLHRELCDA
jgi:hypothetical protein